MEYQIRPRLAGQTFEQFMEFVKVCKAGKRIQLHGVDYVAVDRKSWDEMQSKLSNTKIYFNEALQIEASTNSEGGEDE